MRDTLLAAFHDSTRREQAGSVATWLFGIARHALLDRERRPGHAAVAGRAEPTREDLTEEMAAFSPSVHGPEIELQILAAVAECTDKRFLPQEHLDLERTQVMLRLNELKRVLR